MKIILTTSDRYHHVLKVFCFLFNSFWSDKKPVEIVGYKPPPFDMPGNFSFHSMGQQRHKIDFSADLRKYFEMQDDWFIWMMEDTFIVSDVDTEKIALLELLAVEGVGRINLSNETVKQDHELYRNIQGFRIYENTQTANYRLSTMPSIWSKQFLLKYLRPGLSPWDFESQESINDGYRILGPGAGAPVLHNEGVRRQNIQKLNLTGLPVELLEQMKAEEII